MPAPELKELYTKALMEAGAVLFGRFRLSSGVESPVYIDLRKLLGRPRERRVIVDGLALLLEQLGFSSYPVVGVATGGIAWAAMLARHLCTPFGYVRPRAKEHGTGRLVEGVEPPGEVVLLDDVATTGESLSSAAEALLSSGFTIRVAVVVIDREQGAAQRLARLGIRLHSLITLRELLTTAAGMGYLTSERAEEILRELGL